MADETPNIESQMEAELQSLFAGSPPATGSESGEGTQTPSDAKPGTVPPPTAPATETPEEVPTEELTEQDKILKALDDLDKPAEGEQKPEDKPQAPQLSEDQQIILNNIPDRHTAETLVQIANNHVAFEEAFLEGDFDRVEGMFTHWNKQAYDVFTEKMYEKYVAKDGEWVKRFIAEQEAKANGDEYTYKKTSILEQKIAQLENQLKGRQQQESTQQAQQREQQVFQNYNSELEKLFTRVGITEEADKKFIKSAINAEVVGNKKVAGEIRNGKYDSLTQIFKANANTYLKRDKTFTTRTSQKIDDQSKKKVPIGGGSAGVSQTPAEAEHDFKSVKRGDEDAALDSKLGSFFNKFRRK